MYIPISQNTVESHTWTPQEWVHNQEREHASNFFTSLKTPFTEWDFAGGLPKLISVDGEKLSNALRNQGLKEDEVKAFINLFTSSGFNEMNQRGYARLRSRVSECQSIASQLVSKQYGSLDQIPIGIAMIPYVNAGACPVPHGGDAIMMNFGLVYLFDFFNLRLSIDEDPLSAASLSKLAALAKAIFGDSSNRLEMAKAFPNSISANSSTILRSRIKVAMTTLFVLLHEYGHIFLGHTSKLRRWPDLDLLPPDERLKYFETMREWEYEADRFAHDALLGKFAEIGTPIPGRWYANHTAFDVLGTMSLAVGHELKDEFPEDTHPLPRNRLLKLFRVTEAEYVKQVKAIFASDHSDDEFTNSCLIPLLVKTGAIAAA